MSEPVSHEPKWHWHAAPSEQDGTGRRLRALCAKPPGVMAGFVEDNWSQKCETLQHGRDFLWTGKEPRIGQRIELNCTAPSDMFFRMSGMLTAVDNSPPPPGVMPPIMPHCHDKEGHNYDHHYEAFGNTHYFAKAKGLAVLSFDFWPGVNGGDVRPMCVRPSSRDYSPLSHRPSRRAGTQTPCIRSRSPATGRVRRAGS